MPIEAKERPSGSRLVEISFLVRFVIVIFGHLGIVPILAHHVIDGWIRVARIEIWQKSFDLLKDVSPENNTFHFGRDFRHGDRLA